MGQCQWDLFLFGKGSSGTWFPIPSSSSVAVSGLLVDFDCDSPGYAVFLSPQGSHSLFMLGFCSFYT